MPPMTVHRSTAARALGKLGGLARKRNLSPERRKEISDAANAALAKKRAAERLAKSGGSEIVEK